jgi:hypothetical protein
MSSLDEVGRLLRLSEHRQHQCEQTLQQTLTRLRPVTSELSGITRQQDSLRLLMASQRVGGCTLNHSELMASLRHQANLRRQLQNLGLEHTRLEEQRAQIEGDVHRHQHEQQSLQRRHMKFCELKQRLLKQKMLTSLRREETEIEELTRPSR